MTNDLNTCITKALDDLKAQNTLILDVTELSDVMDTLVITSGSSTRHVKSLADNVIEEGKKIGQRPIGVEGLQAADWVLVDYGSTVVHVMLPDARHFYDLEKLWSPIKLPDSSAE
ncbi:MAG: ribosome silencing factor [Pseudomonadota bacterium]